MVLLKNSKAPDGISSEVNCDDKCTGAIDKQMVLRPHISIKLILIAHGALFNFLDDVCNLYGHPFISPFA